MGLKYKKVGTLLCVSNFDMDSVLWPVCIIIYRHRSNNLYILSLSLFYYNICTIFSLFFFIEHNSQRGSTTFVILLLGNVLLLLCDDDILIK
jgi:hypothetical protein